MTENDDAEHVCSKCTGDKVLRDLVLSDGKLGKCTFCDKNKKCVPLETLANEIHEVLQKYFYLTSSEPEGVDYLMAKEGLWERPGEQVHVVIANIAKVSEALGEAIRNYLSDQHGHYAVKDGGEDPYADDALYEEIGIDDDGFRESWDFFKKSIKTRARFFSLQAQRALDEIFEGLVTLKTAHGTPVIREIKPSAKGTHFYRARVSFSEDELQEILAAPARELGPPPARSARAGRMNASGISVFYGGLDEATCVAEVRAPVGSYVVLGRFECIQPLRVLDFDALKEVFVEGSYFDPEYHLRWKRASFLRRLVEDISQPVMPRDEEFEYLPTQAVSEYLAERVEPRLDGIVFHSPQTGGKGRNVVLFNHACRVEPYELPKGTTIDFSMGWASEDDHDDSITVFEKVPPEKKRPIQKKTDNPIPFDQVEFVLASQHDVADSSGDADEASDYRKPVLRLDISGIRVLYMKSVKYEHHERSVSRHRMTDDRKHKF